MKPKEEPVPVPDVAAPKRRIVGLASVLFALGAFAGAAGLELLPGAPQDVGPAVVSASVSIGKPRTVFRVPLLGSISASTHSAPLEIELRIDEVDPNAVEEALESPQRRERLAAELRQGLGNGAQKLASRSIAGAGIIGAVAAVLLPRRRFWWAVAGGLGGLIGAGSLFALTAAQFQVEAFEEPAFEGPVRHAPRIIEAVQRRAGSIEELRSRFSAGASRLSQILALAGQPLANPARGTVAILHISDIHSNPLGLELAKQLALDFSVDAIVDTGDVTSFGEPVEGRISELIPSLPAPYLLVPGNHDSPANRATLAQTPNVTLLHDNVTEIKGVRIMGWADPAFTARNGITQKEADRLQKAAAPAVAARVIEHSPDVLAVHSRLLAARSMGNVPLVVAGHRHRQSSKYHEKTLLLEVGSTGATGLGSFLVKAEHDYEAQIIYFRESRAVALDYIRLRAFGAEFEVRREILDRDAAA